MAGWSGRQDGLRRLAGKQLFFVGGAPRSGTTWLQRLLDSHPEISCGGEGLFMKHLAEPLDALMAERRKALAAKNSRVFRDGGGYALPAEEDAELLLGTAVLLALERQSAGRNCRAVGEKTPENVFLFARLRQLFPEAKFIGIARDPRDVLTSAWHFFHQPAATADEVAAKFAFIRSAFRSLDNGARTMLALRQQFPADCALVTYETMLQAPAGIAAQLFRLLGVSADAGVVAECVARTSFAAMSGRADGKGQDGAFFRKGVAGDWRSTLNAEMNDLILRELGWMFPAFGWVP